MGHILYTGFRNDEIGYQEQNFSNLYFKPFETVGRTLKCLPMIFFLIHWIRDYTLRLKRDKFNTKLLYLNNNLFIFSEQLQQISEISNILKLYSKTFTYEKEEIKTLIKKVSTQKNFGGKMFYDNFEKY